MAEKLSTLQELRTMPEADVRAQIVTLHRNLWDHRVKARAGALQQTHVLSALRRQIARLETVAREKRGVKS